MRNFLNHWLLFIIKKWLKVIFAKSVFNGRHFKTPTSGYTSKLVFTKIKASLYEEEVIMFGYVGSEEQSRIKTTTPSI